MHVSGCHGAAARTACGGSIKPFTAPRHTRARSCKLAMMNTCEVEGCSYSTTNRSNFAVHARTHTGERPYSCEVEGCGFTATTRGWLTEHTRTHTGERPFSCEAEGCGFIATTRSNLARHVLVHSAARQ